jgi:hypothetical protein
MKRTKNIIWEIVTVLLVVSLFVSLVNPLVFLLVLGFWFLAGMIYISVKENFGSGRE